MLSVDFYQRRIGMAEKFENTDTRLFGGQVFEMRIFHAFIDGTDSTSTTHQSIAGYASVRSSIFGRPNLTHEGFET